MSERIYLDTPKRLSVKSRRGSPHVRNANTCRTLTPEEYARKLEEERKPVYRHILNREERDFFHC